MPAHVLLFNTPNPRNPQQSIAKADKRVPLSVVYLSAYLKKHEHTTRIVDLNVLMADSEPKDAFFEDIQAEILDTVKECRPDLIGLTCLFSKNFPILLHLSELLKNTFPEIPIAIGGLHPTLFAKDILEHCPSIDFIILGEGERQMLALTRMLRSEQASLADVDGIAYRRGQDVVVNPKTIYIENLDALPFPDYEGLNLENYRCDTSEWYNPKKLQLSVVVPLLTSRSCPNRCNFCAMYKIMGPKLRSRSAGHVLNEMQLLYEKFGINYFCIEDDNFTFVKQRAMDICNGIVSRGLNIHFDTRNGLMVKTLDKDIIDAMAEAGLLRAYLAIESGSSFIRNKVMGKGLTDEKIYEVVKLIRRHAHIHLFGFFMLGMPEETFDTMEDTYNMIKKLDIDGANLNFVTPYPGTRLFEQCVRDQLLTSFSPKNVWNIDFLHHGNEHIFIKPYALGLNDVEDFRSRCNRLIEDKIRIAVANGRRLARDKAPASMGKPAAPQ